MALADLFKSKTRKSGVKKIIDETPPVTSRPAPSVAEVTRASASAAYMSDEISVSEVSTDAEGSQVVSEAAVLYANNRIDQAIALLAGHLKADPHEPKHDVWYGLFELYRASGRRDEHEKLSAAFSRLFEISPPGWASGEHPDVKPADTVTPAQSDYIPLKGDLGVTARDQIDRIVDGCAASTALRVSLSGISDITPIGCDLLLEAIHASYKKKVQIQWITDQRTTALFTATLTSAAFSGTKSNWAIVFDIYQFENRRQEFDDLSIEYAIAFEESPPIWHDWRIGTCAIKTDDIATGEPEVPFPEISLSIDDAVYAAPSKLPENMDFTALREYAKSVDIPTIDMTRTEHIDFSAAGNFCAAIADIAATGKRISITNANQMVSAILKVFEVHSMANIETKRFK